MPDQRFIHPCLGHSDKVTMLTDFEFRVWTQYLLSADDFGVMRFSAITVQSDNDSLQERTLSRCRKALDKLRDVGLLQTFLHQGRAYAYQRDWVEYQAVEYPRATMHPKPTDDVIATMDPTTQTLFAKHPGGVGRPKKSPNGSRTVPEPFPNGFQTEKELARAQPRETQTLTLTQTQRLTPTQTPQAPDEQWEQFKAAYPGKGREQGFMALQWFLKGCAEVGFAVLLAGAERYAKSKVVREGFVMGMEKWLEKGLWIQMPETPAETQAEGVKAMEEALAKIDAQKVSRGR